MQEDAKDLSVLVACLTVPTDLREATTPSTSILESSVGSVLSIGLSEVGASLMARTWISCRDDRSGGPHCTAHALPLWTRANAEGYYICSLARSDMKLSCHAE